jgi:mannose-1-phosphate guanylyltransferase/mannose-1-phosphate guanylyltransferase/mannose-6-phosphate isomerase
VSSGEGNTKRIIPVILSGGSGTRLWPLSRKGRPKQMLPLVGDRSMLQVTAARAARRELFAAPLIVTSAGQAAQVAAQLGDGVRLILEPCARNTAPAIALAALSVADDDLLLVMPSDHLISDPEGFVGAVELGLPLALGGMLVIFGVRPTRPETGFGYIRRGEAVGDGVFRVERFLEKPDLAAATAFLADGRYDWNAGIFLFTAGAFLQALETHAPDIAEAARRAMGDSRSAGSVSPQAEIFSAIRSESIDRAVIERAANVVVVPMDVGWSDVGSWQALHAVSAADGTGNAVSGPATLLDTSGCLIRSDGPQVMAIGVHNLAIVAMGDAILVVPLDQSQRVGDAVALLEKGAAGSD